MFGSRKTVAALLVVVVGGGLASCREPVPVPSGTDLSITGLEITQGIQTATNSVTLVAQRSTAVRATLATAVSTPVADVFGRLHVFVNGTEITPTAGATAVNAPFTAPAVPARATEGDTLNFELMAPTGIGASTDVDIRVDVTGTGESNTANNSMSVNDLTFVARTTPSIFFTRIDYTPAGAGIPLAGDVRLTVGDAFVKGIFPVNDGDPSLYRRGLFPTLTYTEDADGDGRLNATGSDGTNLMSLLASCRQLIVNGGLGATNNTFLYGWIRGNPIDGNGLGQTPGFNAFGNTDQARHQRSFAHELGHNFGLNHNTQTLAPDFGWDVGARLPQNPAGNNSTGRLKGGALNDIMVAGQLTNVAWVDQVTYNSLLGSAILAAGSPRLAGPIGPIAQVEPFPRTLVVQGTFAPNGDLLELEPAFRFPWPSEASFEVAGRFTAVATDTEGVVVTRAFDAMMGVDDANAPGGGMTLGFFEVMLPVAPNREVVSLEIRDADGRRLGGFEASDPPRLEIQSPQPGAELGDRTEVTWDLVDADTPLEQIQLQLAYSPDGGETWVPIGVDVPGNESRFTFDSSQIPNSDGVGVIRVFASDGLSTVFEDVANLTVSGNEFEEL